MGVWVEPGMTAIKICGLSTVEHALAATAAGADMVGLVFATSRRQVSLEQAGVIVAALRRQEAGRRVRVVGLFVNEQPGHINLVAKTCGLDYVQLSGSETPEQAHGIAYPIIKAVRLTGSPEEERWLALAHTVSGNTRSNAEYAFAPCPLVVDAHVAGAYGGTGTLADWDRAAALAQTRTFLLAGGLTPDNVTSALAQVQPWGVDVSSGVETDGHKDAAQIERFVRRVRDYGKRAVGSGSASCEMFDTPAESLRTRL